MIFKMPETEREYEGMWALNHAVFAEEIGQHAIRPEGRLVDKFHAKNIYYVSENEAGEVVGMVAAHWSEPYSVVGHFGDGLARFIRSGHTAEIRLLCFFPEYRKRIYAVRLALEMLLHLHRLRLDSVVICGIAAQKKFYEHIGFQAVGKPVISGRAEFFPMFGRIPDILARNPVVRRYGYGLFEN